ncbi:MAG: hypothetical protein QOK39_890 [Acidimicrobiaceae bacterium]|nr:hypothetical protein [Acidimicrobiaceae bacterium]
MAGVQVAVASAKGSPGVSTLGLVMGLVWPDPVVVGDLDPAGSDLRGRLPALAGEDTASLAAAARHGLSWDLLAGHTQTLSGSCRLLVGRPDRVLSAGVVRVLAPGLPGTARAAGVAGIWDVGRLDPGSPAWPAVSACDLVIVVARPTAPDLAQVIPLAQQLLEAGLDVGLVVASPRRRRGARSDEEVAAEVAQRLGGAAVTLGRMPLDPLGVSMAERVQPRWAGRSALGAAARQLVAAIAARVTVADSDQTRGEGDQVPDRGPREAERLAAAANGRRAGR